jgi:hypothetical protein
MKPKRVTSIHELICQKTATRFIENFDDLRHVKPFSFRVKLKDAVVKALGIPKRYIVSKAKKAA